MILKLVLLPSKPARLSYVQGVLFALLLVLVSSAPAQTTRLSRQLDRLDLGVGGAAIFTKSASGANYLNQPVDIDPSTTLGAVVQVRYIKSPLIGAEFNYTYARYTESYSGSPFGGSASTPTPFNVQTNASEYSIGYVAHLPTLLGVQPFAGAGVGGIDFKPTKLGGQSLPNNGRISYYYDVGVDDQFTRFFGVRAQLRQVFYEAPDFGQNYLAISKRTFTTQPTVGFYIKF